MYSKNYTICKITCEEYLANGLRTADQPLHHEQQWVLQQDISCNKQFRQFRTPIMCDILDCDQSLFSQSSLAKLGRT